jgi:coenzyme F420 biosynthesis associated uncharacterized protein
MIDWELAGRVASMVSGSPPDGGAPITTAELEPIGVESERLVVAYTGLEPVGVLPAPEAVDRGEWIDANLASMRPLMDPLVDRMASGMGPLATPVRAATGLVVGVQVGALTGYMAQRVLGQYEMAMLDPDAPTRLLFVAPNLDHAARELGADRGELLSWVGFHEVTHAVQFAGVPWLRSHMAGLVRLLLDSVEVSVDPARVMRLPSTDDLRALVAALREGDFISFVAGAERRELVDRLQATMAMIEGHAEHVMDAVGSEALPSLERLRGALDRRRATRPPLLRLLERLMGLDMKMRQYELGKGFCDAVVAAGGIEALNRAWSSPQLLPTLGELEAPEKWLDRSAVARPAA